MSKPEVISIDGTNYVRQDAIPSPPSGNRAVVVVDRGWIWAGDVEEKDGKIILTRAVWVFSWSSVGFDGVIQDPKSNNVKLKRLDNPVEIPAGSEIFRVPVRSDWGL